MGGNGHFREWRDACGCRTPRCDEWLSWWGNPRLHSALVFDTLPHKLNNSRAGTLSLAGAGLPPGVRWLVVGLQECPAGAEERLRDGERVGVPIGTF